jgi:hypothetical protein
VSGALLGLVGLVYIWVALDYAWSGRWGMALAFLAYALANVGLILDFWKPRGL